MSALVTRLGLIWFKHTPPLELNVLELQLNLNMDLSVHEDISVKVGLSKTYKIVINKFLPS